MHFLRHAIENFLNSGSPFVREWGYLIVFVISVLESLPLVGLFIPGAVIVVLGGFLAKNGLLDIGDLIIFASTGALIGDVTGYFIGRRYGYDFLFRYGRFFFFKKEYFEKVRAFVAVHTGKSLILGRFNSLTRTLTPFTAGVSAIRPRQFIWYAILGAMSWGIFHVLLGFIFAKGFDIVSKYLGIISIAGVLLSVFIIYTYRMLNKYKHVFNPYSLYILVGNVVSLYLFSKITEAVVRSESILRIDAWVGWTLLTWHSNFLDVVMKGVNFITQPIFIAAAYILLLAVLFVKKFYYKAIFCAVTLGGSFLLGEMFKLIILRDRPMGALVTILGFSYPSGHALGSIVFIFLLIYLFSDRIKHWHFQIFFKVGLVFLIGIIGFSRLYLNVHWFTDVVGGYTLGLFWFTLMLLSSRIISFFGKTKISSSGSL